MTEYPLSVLTFQELSALKPAQVRAVAALLNVTTPNGKPSSSVERVWDAITDLLDAPRKARQAQIIAAHQAAHPELHAEYARMERQWEDGKTWFDARIVTGPNGCGLLTGTRHATPEQLRAHLIRLGWDDAHIIDDTARPAHAQVLAESSARFRARLRQGARRLGFYQPLDQLTRTQVHQALAACPEATTLPLSNPVTGTVHLPVRIGGAA